MYKRSFWEVGEWLQETATTEAEANERFACSCNRCNKAAICNENKCPIAKAHETKLLILNTKSSKKHQIFWKTRKYKTTPQANIKKAVLNFLTRLSKVITDYDKQIIIDDASVMAELGELESAYWVLRNARLNKTAERVMSIIKGTKEG